LVKKDEGLRLSVVHTIAGLKDRAGGVSRSVPGLCEALAREGCQVTLVTQQPSGTAPEALLIPDPALLETRLLPGHDWERWRFSYTPNLERRLGAVCSEFQPQVLHDHGLWLHMNHAVARTASRLGIARVVSPRGMLDEWALSYRGWRKSLAWHAYQLNDLRTASAFCATSFMEARGIRALGFRQAIAVIPNGVELPDMSRRDHAGVEPRTVLFMSRLHPKKGLLDLVAAWGMAAAPGWRLVIAGPDEGGHRRVVEEAVARAGLSESIRFAGAVAGTAKRELFSAADIFVLPSYSENFGIVIAEALAHGVPVIATTATPWEELRSRQCGWWIEPGASPLAESLKQAMQVPVDERSAMGRRGRLLIEEHYSWRSIARQHIEFYRWLGGGAPRPVFLAP
jgi:glycosyltransferase involved in cell wall biosynthesis